MSKFSEIQEDKIILAINKGDSIRGILRELGLSSGEYNRKQLKRFIEEHNITYKQLKFGRTTPLSKITETELNKVVAESDTYREVLNKLGYKGQARNGAYITLKNKIHKWGINTEHMSHKKVANNKRATYDTVFTKNSPHAPRTIREFIIRNKVIQYKCAICGNDGRWNGKPLALTLDHINGDHNDNRKENLRFICPNCDRQSDTYGSRNKIRYYK